MFVSYNDEKVDKNMSKEKLLEIIFELIKKAIRKGTIHEHRNRIIIKS